MRYLLPLLLLVGCGGKSVKSVADAHRAAAAAKLAKISELAPVVEKQPLLTQDSLSLPEGVRLDYRPFREGYNSDMSRSPNPEYNTAIAFEHQLAKPSTAESLYWQSGGKDLFLLSGLDHCDQWLIEPACVVETGMGRNGSEPVVSLLEEGFSWLERTKYLLVLRLRTRQPPGLVMEELKAGEMKTFSGGRIAGDAVLYEIDTARFLGGITVEGRSDENVEVRKGSVHSQLQLKLAANAEAEIRKKMEQVGDPPR